MAQIAAITVEVLRTSERGAKLVTDGTKAAWVMGRMVRPDNTLTYGGVKELEAAKMTDAEARDYDAYITKQREEREAARAAARAEAAKKRLTVELPQSRWFGEAGKAYKVWTGYYTWNMYHKSVREFVYLPKSQVEVISAIDGVVRLNMPEWLANQHSGVWAEKAVEATPAQVW